MDVKVENLSNYSDNDKIVAKHHRHLFYAKNAGANLLLPSTARPLRPLDGLKIMIFFNMAMYII